MSKAWGGVLPPSRGQGYYPSDFAPAANEPGLPGLHEAINLRRLADLIVQRRSYPSHDQSIPDYYAALAVHSLADSLRELANEIDPPSPPPARSVR